VVSGFRLQDMKIPQSARNGDTVIWLDEPTVDVFGQAVDATNHTLVYYLRANASAAAETLTATAQGSQWRFTWVVNERSRRQRFFTGRQLPPRSAIPARQRWEAAQSPWSRILLMPALLLPMTVAARLRRIWRPYRAQLGRCLLVVAPRSTGLVIAASSDMTWPSCCSLKVS
jgi:hypothetical protein